MSLYDIAGYGAMVGDEARFHAYRDAMREQIGASTTVLDIGTGTGHHALVACQLGARHVYAVEPSDSIQVAREIARDNGFEDRISFIQDISTRVTLPERQIPSRPRAGGRRGRGIVRGGIRFRGQ